MEKILSEENNDKRTHSLKLSQNDKNEERYKTYFSKMIIDWIYIRLRDLETYNLKFKQKLKTKRDKRSKKTH